MIEVKLKKPSSRRFWLAQWVDPVTERIRTRSTQHTVKRDAERFAARLEDELNSGIVVSGRITWEAFWNRYVDEVSSTKRIKTKRKTISTINAITEYVDPKHLTALAEPNIISKFSATLRAKPLAPATVDGHLREVRKMLRWAKRMHLIKAMPHIEFPNFDDEMKGRPITEEEFDRMVAKVPDCVKFEEFVEGWQHHLRGLWLSGLRLNESMLLHWTNDKYIAVDLSHKRPMFRIQAKADKSKTYRLLPMAPDFADFLQQTPKNLRHGYVFNPLTVPRGGRYSDASKTNRQCVDTASDVISSFGEAAGIKVNETKFASAQDLRRSFGTRWCKIVMPPVLKEMMRHDSIQTTMQFYVEVMAEDAADEIYRAVALRSGNTFGNTDEKTDHQADSDSSSDSTKQGNSKCPRQESNLQPSASEAD